MQVSSLGAQIDCEYRVVRLGRPQAGKARLLGIETDAAILLLNEPLAAGVAVKLRINGWCDEELDARIATCKPQGSGKYKVLARLSAGAWPYATYVRLAGLNFNPELYEPVPECFAELGLPRECTSEDVENAFARRVRIVHPDRGGTVDDFVRLRLAYLEALQRTGASR